MEFLLKTMLNIPIQFGPSRGQRRDEPVVKRVVDLLLPIWNGETAAYDLTVESLSQLRHNTLLMYEPDSIFHKSREALEQRLAHCKSVILEGGHLDGGRLKHFTLMEIPEQLLDHTRSFLESQEVEARQQNV